MARSSSSSSSSLPPATSASVILICTTVAVLLLLLLTSLPSPGTHHPRPRHHRRLRIHRPSPSGENHRPTIPFDPVVAALERRVEEKQWERDHFDLPHDHHHHHHHHQEQEEELSWEESFDHDDYLNDEEHFNITHRIVLLFPQIDVDPADGFVSSVELAEWNFRQATKESLHRTDRELELHDKNRDGFVSFQEYATSNFASFHHDTFNNSVGWWKEDHFNASDVDGNGLLNLTEFNDFLHPADSGNSKLLMWLCKEEIRQRDKDEDGKINFDEYFQGLFDLLHEDDGSSKHSRSYEQANKIFVELDQDNDRFLSEDELKPIVGKLSHSERYNAKEQTVFEFSQADSDKDGQLSLQEMIEHPYVFYSSIFSDDEDEDYDDDDYGHDEFR